MKQFQGFKCDHCGKLYQLRHACERHEDNTCKKHPNNLHPCWKCPHLIDGVVDQFYGDDPWTGEVWAKSKAFYCEKRKINLYSHGFDKHIKSFHPAEIHEEKPLQRMPSKLNPCDQYENITWKVNHG